MLSTYLEFKPTFEELAAKFPGIKSGGVNIDDSLMKPEEKGIIEDLVTAAFNDARDKADRVSAEQMKEMQGSMGLPPGFNLPGMG